MSEPHKKAEQIAADARPNQVAVKPDRDTKIGAQVDGKEDGVAKASNAKKDVGTVAEQFPTDGLNARDPDDAVMEVKYELQKGAAGQDTGTTPFGEMTWDDKYAAYLLRKQEAARLAEFQQWFAQKYDKMDDAQKQVARELYPNFYAQRVEMLNKNLENMKRYAEVKIEGVRNKDDLALLYAVDRGMLPMDVYRNILFPELANQSRRQQFKRGLFNTNRYFKPGRGGTDGDAQADLGRGYQTLEDPFVAPRTATSTVGEIARNSLI